MSAFTQILFLLLVAYIITLLVLAAGYSRTPWFQPRHNEEVPVSIIVCARNEEAHLGNCLWGLLAQDYPPNLIQIIVVNDASTDRTLLIADTVLENANIDHRILSNPSRKGKKSSISQAIKFARHELIILRDADTYTTSVNWLRDVAAAHTHGLQFVIAPIAVQAGNNLLSALQAVESAILALVTAGPAYYKKPFLCSGANLAFSKQLFVQTGGYTSHNHLVSGDDIFFLHDVKKIPNATVGFLKSPDAVVNTYPLRRLKPLILQKARWASKFRHHFNFLNLWIAFLVFTVNGAVIYALCKLILEGDIWPGAYIFLKILTDLFLLYLASAMIKTGTKLRQLIPVAFIYPFYALITGLMAIFIKPVWKEE